MEDYDLVFVSGDQFDEDFISQSGLQTATSNLFIRNTGYYCQYAVADIVG